MKRIKVIFTNDDLEFINNAIINSKFSKLDVNKIKSMSENDLLFLIDVLSESIGYDNSLGDIDKTGMMADRIIEKLLFLVYDRQGSVIAY